MPRESTTPDLVKRSGRVVEALSRRDLDAALNSLAPDAVYEAVSLGTTFEGAEAIRGFLQDWLGAYAEYEMDAEEILDLGNGVVFVVLGLAGRPAVGGNALTRRRPVILTWLDGLVTRVTAPSSGIDEARAAAEGLAQERG
jgi:ketosteroid isomerase-like protein